MSNTSNSPLLRAAGAVLWRQDPAGSVEVAVVHRPRYDDWSLPKGKLDPGETAPVAAVRELHEETGCHAVLGRYLTRISYDVAAKAGVAHKTVDYFSARALPGGDFTPNREVDELRWLPPDEAAALLTYPADVSVLGDFGALPAELTTLFLVRHAKAGKRDEWNGDDDLRPLAEAGHRQARALTELLAAFGPDDVYSAPRLRCVQTVQGVAEELGIEVRHEPLLAEEGYWVDPGRGLGRLLDIVAAGGTPVVCSQGGVIPDVVATLAERDGVDLPLGKHGQVASKKGSLWLLSFLPPAGEQGPKLVAAEYFPSPLPAPTQTPA